jgi:peroxiredoxin
LPLLIAFPVLLMVSILAGVGLTLNAWSASTSATPVASVRAPTPTLEIQGRPAPPFELTTLDGQTVSLSDYQGRIVFLNFWATWCEPCKRELPAFTAFTQQNQTANSPVVLAVNLLEGPDQITPFLTSLGVRTSSPGGFSILLDSNRAVANAYGVINIPVTYVIDATGTIRYPKYGEVTLDDLQTYVALLGS